MKNVEQLLRQTFVLARRDPAPLPSELPFGMETAVLAEWRSSRSKIDINSSPVFRWAAIVTCAVALLGGAWKRDELAQISRRFDPETRIVDSAFLTGLGQ
jgi:hypothetical protein